MVGSEFLVPCILYVIYHTHFHPAGKRPRFVFSRCEDSQGWWREFILFCVPRGGTYTVKNVPGVCPGDGTVRKEI